MLKDIHGHILAERQKRRIEFAVLNKQIAVVRKEALEMNRDIAGLAAVAQSCLIQLSREVTVQHLC